MDYEDVLDKVGGCGLAQIIYFNLLAFTAFQTGTEIQLMLLALQDDPKFLCIDPRLNTTITPVKCWGDQCSSGIRVIEHECSLEFYNNATPSIFVTPCTKWKYSQLGSMTAEYDLICERANFRTYLKMTYFAGEFIGSILSLFGDRFGRKTFIIAMAAMEIVSSLASGFLPSLPSLFVARFIRASCTIICIQGWTLLSEILSSKHRDILGVFYWVYFGLGYMAAALFAYISSTWRIARLISLVPSIVYLLFPFVIPESPRWLLLEDRKPEAIAVLKRIAKLNCRNVPDDVYNSITCKHETSDSIFNVFRSPNVRFKSIVSWIVFVLIYFCYYSIIADDDFASTNIYVNIVVGGAMEFPTGPIAGIVSLKLGKRWTTFSFLCISCLIVLTTGFLPLLNIKTLPNWFIVSTAALGKLTMDCAYVLCNMILVEQFPTSVRNTGIGLAYAFGTAVLILGPYVINLQTYLIFLPNTIIAGIGLLAGFLLVSLLPDTDNLPLAQTIEESESLVRGKEKLWLENHRFVRGASQSYMELEL